jgi:UDP-N-acetylmuramoyl-L-alanyl-D-glutamate--2,6-diaminopimelate ligase
MAGALLVHGKSLAQIAAVTPHLRPPPGRMESLGGHAAPLVVIDYAHTPDALEKVLLTLQDTASSRHGRLLCLFGCGGGRDPGKRPLMGAIAEQQATQVILTSDNPRHEAPEAIIADIRSGMRSTPRIEVDRAQAIRQTIAAAGPTDLILIAGKGDESYQEIAGVRLPFADRAVASAALAAWREPAC